MIVGISAGAESDLAEAFWFYEGQSQGLGDYFRACLIADIESRVFLGGIHEGEHGYHRALSKTFPFGIYYRIRQDQLTIVGVLDLRREPQWIRESLDRRGSTESK